MYELVCKNAVLLMESALYYSCLYAMLLFMLTARPKEALPYAKRVFVICWVGV